MTNKVPTKTYIVANDLQNSLLARYRMIIAGISNINNIIILLSIIFTVRMRLVLNFTVHIIYNILFISINNIHNYAFIYTLY